MGNNLLHIICMMKIVEDMDDISKKEYMQAGEGCMDMSYIKKMINCFDEAALEYALRIKDKRCEAGLDTRISVLSLDPGYASHFLNPFFAMRADDVIDIETDGTTWFCPKETARILSSEIKKIKEENCRTIIFAGKQAPPLNSSLVPVYISDDLNLMMLNEVSDIYYKDGSLIAERTSDKAFEYYRINREAVIVFGNTKHSCLRVPTLREKMKYKKHKPEIVSCKLGHQEQEPGLTCPIRETRCEFTEYENERDAARIILEQIL